MPEELFRGAFAWGQTIFEGATILGPAVGGLVYGIFRTPAPVYAAAMVAVLWPYNGWSNAAAMKSW